MSEPKPFSTLPVDVKVKLEPLTVAFSDTQVSELQTLIRLSKLAPATWEGLQEDRRFGITTKWITEAKEYWENHFDWYARVTV